jgi:hypothetical protein
MEIICTPRNIRMRNSTGSLSSDKLKPEIPEILK